MADVIRTRSGANRGETSIDQTKYHDNGDGSFDESIASHQYVWDGSQWVKATASGGGGGGAVTVADGADVAQGTTTDLASASTVVGILKAVKAAVQGTLTVAASGETNTIYQGTTALTPKFAAITASAGGATTVVAAVSSKRIRVLSYVLIANGTVNVKFQSHVTPTDLTGLLYCTSNSGASSGFSPVGHFQTVAGEALDINLSGGIAVGGHLTYLEA